MNWFKKRRFRRELRKLIGFRPGNPDLYRQAFTHKSAGSRRGDELLSNERLEYLGDAVLGMVIAAYLYRAYPGKNEGFLSQLRARVVNREFFNNIGREMKLDVWMEQVAPHSADVNISPSILGNAFEALVGAIYLDKGLKTVERFFRNNILGEYLDLDEVTVSDTNYKSRLLEWSQKNNHKVEFRLLETKREGGKLIFKVETLIDDAPAGQGSASQKKKAEQVAALHALKKMGLAE